MVTPADLAAIAELSEKEQLGARMVVIDGPDVGQGAVVDVDRGYVSGSMPPDIADDVLSDAHSLMMNEQNRTLTYGEREVYIETVAPQPHLLIFGAVHIAQSLARIAKDLGFRVTVNDARPVFTTRERFPDVDSVIVGWPNEVMDELVMDRRTYVVILSHDARFEEPVLPAVLASPARYIGAMGSRRTHIKRMERLEAAGYTEEQIARIHGPVGLDIGAELPGEVAVSILAEMIQVRYGSGSGDSLKGRSGRIHLQRTEDEGDV
ncbi:MAG: XdhC family protein [Acidimicrobiia bacterium]|nr:XdhC family protein [Acidimicrobiia bacterium]